MRQLITGGAGFIGYNLAAALSEAGEDVVLVDNLARGRVDEEMRGFLERGNVELLELDLEDPEAVRALPNGVDRVFHLAAVVGVRNVLENPDRVLRVNARTTLNMLDWFVESDGSAFFFSSTSEAYAWTHKVWGVPIPTPEDVPLAVDDIGNRRASYAVSKYFGEMAVTHTCERVRKRYIIARYHNVYGPRMGLAHVIPEVYKRIHEGQDPLELYNVEDQRAFCYVDDAIRATIDLMAEGVASGVYNIGNSEEEVTIGELGRIMLEAGGRPDGEVRALKSSGPGISRRVPDTGKLKSAIGYEPAVPLREGVRRTLAWYGTAFEREKSPHV